jgi:Tol biopolymer transport system component
VAEGQASWSPDDSRIVFSNGTLGIYLMDDDGSNLTRLVPHPRNTYLHDPAWKH